MCPREELTCRFWGKKVSHHVFFLVKGLKSSKNINFAVESVRLEARCLAQSARPAQSFVRLCMEKWGLDWDLPFPNVRSW